jgi:hypothetical protein
MIRRLLTTGAALLLMAASAVTFTTPVAAAGLDNPAIDLISATPSGGPSDNNGKGSFEPAVSNNGRYIVFDSSSQNILPSGPLPSRQTLLYDAQTKTLEVESVSASGEMANGGTQAIGVSNDGRYVYFNSGSTNLGPTLNTTEGVFMRDRQANTTTLISPANYLSFAQPHSVSADGNVITFTVVTHQATTGADNKSSNFGYVYNRTSGASTVLPDYAAPGVGNGEMTTTISGNGRYVTYSLTDTPGDFAGTPTHAYRYDTANGDVMQIDVDGRYGVALNYAGDKALYYINDYNNTGAQVNLYLKDLTSGVRTTVVSDAANSSAVGSNHLSFSNDDHLITYLLSTASSNTAHVKDLNDGQDVALDHGNVITNTLTGDGKQVIYDGISTEEGTRFQVYRATFGSLQAPTNLTAATPTNNPVLQWSAVSGANQYKIYRDGAQVGTSTTTTYTDSSAPEGNHTYYVTAADSTGGKPDSAASNTVNVLVDKTVPTVGTPTLSPAIVLLTNTMSISANAADALSGVANGEYYIDTDPGQGHGQTMNYANGKLTATASAANLTAGFHRLYVRSHDAAGNWSTASYAFYIRL